MAFSTGLTAEFRIKVADQIIPELNALGTIKALKCAELVNLLGFQDFDTIRVLTCKKKDLPLHVNLKKKIGKIILKKRLKNDF